MTLKNHINIINLQIQWGVAKWPKAPGFGPGIRGFESFHPSQQKTTFEWFFLQHTDLTKIKKMITCKLLKNI